MGYLVHICDGQACPQLHQWQMENLECPYGLAFAEVTWPNRQKLRTTRDTHPNTTIIGWDNDDPIQGPFMTSLCVFYGYVTYAVILMNSVAFVHKRGRGTRELSFLLFAGGIVLINELILKKLFQKARPEQSCLTSCGMPSGHSTFAAGFLTVMFLDSVYRLNSSQEEYLDYKLIASERRTNKQRMRDAWLALRLNFTVTPLAKETELSVNEFLASLSCWCVILLPVPLSRVAIRDQTPLQVLVGSVFGCVEGVLWASIMRRFQFMCLGSLGKRYLFVQHNLALPQFLVEYLCDPENLCDPKIRRRAIYALANWYVDHLVPEDGQQLITHDDSNQGFCSRLDSWIESWAQPHDALDAQTQDALDAQPSNVSSESAADTELSWVAPEAATQLIFDDQLRDLARIAKEFPADVLASIDYQVFMATYVILSFAGRLKRTTYKHIPRVTDVMMMLRKRLVREVKELSMPSSANEAIKDSYKLDGHCPLKLWLQRPLGGYVYGQTASLRAWCEEICVRACRRGSGFTQR